MTDVRGLSIQRSPLAVPPPPRRLGTRVALPLLLLSATLGAIGFGARDVLWPAPRVRVEPVVVAATRAEAPGAISVTAPGWIAPDPFSIRVVALTEGIVSAVLALDGDRVEAGQVVATLLPDDARIALDRARAVRDHRTASLATIDAERATIAPAVAAAEAAIAATREELELKRPLADGHTIAVTELSRLRAKLLAEESALAAARARGPSLEARLAEARAELAIAEVDVTAAELRLARTEIRAPVDGVVLRRVATPGTVVGPLGTAAKPDVLELYDPSALLVRADVPYADAARVGVGQRATVTVEALHDRTFAGRVVRAIQEADVAKNTVSFHVVLDATDGALRPEMIARVRFLADAPPPAADAPERTALFVPRRALRGDRVLVVVDRDGDRGRIDARTVECGADRDGYVEISAGLHPGDRVLVDGPADLADGARVTVDETGGAP